MLHRWMLCLIQIGLFCSIDGMSFPISVMELFYKSDSDYSSKYDLYTRANPNDGYQLKIWDRENLIESPFEVDNPIKVIIHGFRDYPEYRLINFKDNYLKKGNYNVIIVDWRTLASEDYISAAKGTEKIGLDLSELLEFLKQVGRISLSNVHILGHSLGAYIAGYSALFLSKFVGRITAMDPPSPSFCPFCSEPKLNTKSAVFVDVIHTCTEWYGVGIKDALGHVDFYPNGGKCEQPGCLPIYDFTQYSKNNSASCGHARSYEFMMDSILYSEEFLAVKCDNWEEYEAGNCKNESTAFMGEYVSSKVRGKYFLETNGDSPYGKAFIESKSTDRNSVGMNFVTGSCFTKRRENIEVVFISM